MCVRILVVVIVLLVLLPFLGLGQTVSENLDEGIDLFIEGKYRKALLVLNEAIATVELESDTVSEEIAIIDEMNTDVLNNDWEELPHHNNPNPTLADLYFFRAQCYYQLKDYTRALSDFNSAIHLGYAIEDGAVYRLRGLCYFHQQNYQMAIQDFEKEFGLPHWQCGAVYPFNQTYYYLGISHIKLGEQAIGCGLLQQAANEEYLEAQGAICKYCR